MRPELPPLWTRRAWQVSVQSVVLPLVRFRANIVMTARLVVPGFWGEDRAVFSWVGHKWPWTGGINANVVDFAYVHIPALYGINVQTC